MNDTMRKAEGSGDLHGAGESGRTAISTSRDSCEAQTHVASALLQHSKSIASWCMGRSVKLQSGVNLRQANFRTSDAAHLGAGMMNPQLSVIMK